MKTSTCQARNFATQKHTSGDWNTAFSHRYSLVKKLAGKLLSRKHAGVAWLASLTATDSLVCDLGCGKGAYTYWMLSHTRANIVAVDWSICALKSITPPLSGKILPVCADVSALPFKANSFSYAYSIDTLGHVLDSYKAIQEWERIMDVHGHMFLHSEINDYIHRWPTRIVLKRAGFDPVAVMDGHFGLKNSFAIKQELQKSFQILSTQSPAGYLGWIFGYPEKYHIAFNHAHMPFFAFICFLMAGVKRVPVLGIVLRSINIFSNTIELLFGACGGGSLFAKLTKNGHE